MILQELLKIDGGRKSRSIDVEVKFVFNRILTEERKGFWSKVWGKITNKPYLVSNLLKFHVINKVSKNTYTCLIQFDPSDNFQKLLRSKVKIFCQCNDFKYRSAYILNQEDNIVRLPVTESHLGIALNEKPRVITPTKMCKHMYAVIEYLRDNIQKLDLTI